MPALTVLKLRLIESGTSQTWLAREIDAPLATINAIANGREIPAPERLEAIAAAIKYTGEPGSLLEVVSTADVTGRS